MIFCTHVEHSPTKTVYMKYYMEKQTHALHTHTYACMHANTHTHTHTHSDCRSHDEQLDDIGQFLCGRQVVEPVEGPSQGVGDPQVPLHERAAGGSHGRLRQ